ncbi:xanthine dehydrogenase family protein subunit M [Bradyrhizobium sp. 14AA]
MYPFKYRRPRNVEEAVQLFNACDDACYISGGHTLLPTLKARLAQPSDVIDLSALPELRGIEEIAGGILVRGGTVHSDVAASPLVRSKIPVLAGLAGSIGDRHVRHRGTIGGSVANNDPAADYPAAVLSLGATVVTDRRRVSGDDYFIGLYETCRKPGEIVTGVEFPIPDSAGYAKFRNLASRYALAASFVCRTGDEVRIAVTGAYNTGVTRPAALEQALTAEFAEIAIEPLDIDPEDMLADPAATAAYRAALVKSMTKRAVSGQGAIQVFK